VVKGTGIIRLKINRQADPTKIIGKIYQERQPIKVVTFQGLAKNLFLENIFRNIYKVNAQFASN
jgi:hypothetical protein